MRLRALLAAAAIGLLLIVAVPSVERITFAAEQTQTVQNLLKSLKAELSARSRYLAFAAKADEEGYGGVACLFHAQARAEEIHAERYQKVLRNHGVEPPAEYELAFAKSTKDNLAASIDIERLERDSIYPSFIDEATKDNDREAAEAFELAKATEVEHFNLCTEAIQKLDEMKRPRDYYVCGVCGYTAPYLVFAKCVACGAPKSKFEAVR